MINDLNIFWNNKFADFIPEAHKLKHNYKDRWVRFHSLPESKRYPENESEYCEMLRRHNLLLHELCGDEAKFILVLTEYSEVAEPTHPESELLALFPKTEFWSSIDQCEADYGCYWHLHVSAVEFTGNEFNNLLCLVADNHVSNVLIINLKAEVIFHPYDGGVDIILATTEQRDFIKKKFSTWLSKHPESL